MAKEELFRVPVLGALIRLVNAFPVRRGGADVSALRTAERVVKAGGAVIVFPEGRRHRTGQLGPPKAGVALLAQRTGAPVIPVYCRNTHRAKVFAHFEVVFGPPFRRETSETNDTFSRRVMDAIRQLKEDFDGSAN